jgi:hypothetical protein
MDFGQLQSGKLVNGKACKLVNFTSIICGLKEVCFAPSFATEKQSEQCV